MSLHNASNLADKLTLRLLDSLIRRMRLKNSLQLNLHPIINMRVLSLRGERRHRMVQGRNFRSWGSEILLLLLLWGSLRRFFVLYTVVFFFSCESSPFYVVDYFSEQVFHFFLFLLELSFYFYQPYTCILLQSYLFLCLTQFL